MELTREPSQNNIKLLQGIKGFADFEKKVLEENKISRTLTIGPDTKFINVIMEMLKLKDDFLNFTMQEIKDWKRIPINYFDIIVWGSFDPETHLRDIKNVLIFLGDGSIFIPLTSFEALFRKCLSMDEYKKFPANHDNIIKLLKNIYNELDLQIVRYKSEEFVRLHFPTGQTEDIDIVVDTIQFNNQIFTNVIAGQDPCYNIPKCNPLFGEKRAKEIKEFYDKIENEINSLLRVGIDTETEILARLVGFDYSHLTTNDDWLSDLIRKKITGHLAEESPVHITTRYPTSVQTTIPLPIVMTGLKNVGGFSCFMDSVLIALLFDETGYLFKALQKQTGLSKDCQVLRDELLRLNKAMRSEKQYTCNPIIDKLKKCNSRTKELLTGEQQDDAEFMQILFDIFSLEPTTVVVKKAVGDDKVWVDYNPQTVRETLLEVRVPDSQQDLLQLYQNVYIDDYRKIPLIERPKGPDGKHYHLLRSSNTIVDSDLLTFHIARVEKEIVGGKIKYTKNNKPVSFTQFVSGDDKNYELSAVTIHTGNARGGHYTAFFKYNGVWFYYDDLKKNVNQTTWSIVKEIGKTGGSLFIYTPLKS